MSTPIHRARLDAVKQALERTPASGAGRGLLDLGCGDGALLLPALEAGRFARIAGVDLCAGSLARLRRMLSPDQAARTRLIEGDFTAPALARSLTGYDAAALVEVIEHMSPDRLSAVEQAVFRAMRPALVVITTPNAEFNALLGVPAHRMRHPDHRFEWDRAQFSRWCEGVAARAGYRVEMHCIGGAHPALGGPTQMAVFSLAPR